MIELLSAFAVGFAVGFLCGLFTPKGKSDYRDIP